jgi:hypothetical protein
VAVAVLVVLAETPLATLVVLVGLESATQLQALRLLTLLAVEVIT